MVTDSVGFYRGVSQQGGYNKPLVFALICFEIYTLLNGLSWLFLSTLFSGIFAEGAGSTVRLPGVDVTSLGTLLAALLVVPIVRPWLSCGEMSILVALAADRSRGYQRDEDGYSYSG